PGFANPARPAEGEQACADQQMVQFGNGLLASHEAAYLARQVVTQEARQLQRRKVDRQVGMQHLPYALWSVEVLKLMLAKVQKFDFWRNCLTRQVGGNR